MTASGPFAMGPALAGTSARRTAPRSNFTPIVPQGPGGASRLGAGLTQTEAPTIGVKREPGVPGTKEKERKVEEDEAEAYSDPDEGVEIVDMENVRTMDWMAPESLRKEKKPSKKKKVKAEEADKKDKTLAIEEGVAEPEAETGVNLANAVDLSESEDEEEMEDIMDDFAFNQMETDDHLPQDLLYFFQFPEPFPEFVSRISAESKGKGVGKPEDGGKSVTFSDDTKPPAPDAPQDQAGEKSTAEEKVDGVVGQLEVYESGAVKMRLANGIVMDVSAATQPSFLQHAVHLDPAEKRLCVLGEINRRFVVSPNIDTLLSAMELAEQPQQPELDVDGLISMDTT
ncbi:RNA polymerase III RPC4-domain-containing protein [Phanerochaete sordida]|uniref:RNA polymerase III RPC4-domain-containing protein n=1 Tax=Phanerochaete sordida TaxID=48140 RepID=A0A9P3G9W1_9APHY|nr:RNA polymerase III RPC4-domain-containing protein [Phanerochaete sordida]